jgi:hypothetical protein
MENFTTQLFKLELEKKELEGRIRMIAGLAIEEIEAILWQRALEAEMYGKGRERFSIPEEQSEFDAYYAPMDGTMDGRIVSFRIEKPKELMAECVSSEGYFFDRSAREMLKYDVRAGLGLVQYILRNLPKHIQQ